MHRFQRAAKEPRSRVVQRVVVLYDGEALMGHRLRTRVDALLLSDLLERSGWPLRGRRRTG